MLVRSPLDTPGRDKRMDAFVEEATSLGIRELFERRALQASFDCMRRSRYAADRDSVPYHMYRL